MNRGLKEHSKTRMVAAPLMVWANETDTAAKDTVLVT
jgi:hypothetical protein